MKQIAPVERLSCIRRGVADDRIPFMPTILEHAARIIRCRPSEAALDGRLLAKAHIEAYRLYGHDAVTVGIDVYDVEAEALGCMVHYPEDLSIPGIVSHPMQDFLDLDNVRFRENSGRIGMLLDAASEVQNHIGSEVNVSVGISGPFSIAVELCGFGRLINLILDESPEVGVLLEAVLAHQCRYCDCIARRELGVTIFESWATPPLVSPWVYHDYVLPYESRLISYLKVLGLAYVPLIIGGNTAPIVRDILNSGTSLLVADYPVCLEDYLAYAKERNLMLRANIDPKLVEAGPDNVILESTDRIMRIVSKSGYIEKFILGTGVISYSTPSENLLHIRDRL